MQPRVEQAAQARSDDLVDSLDEQAREILRLGADMRRGGAGAAWRTSV